MIDVLADATNTAVQPGEIPDWALALISICLGSVLSLVGGLCTTRAAAKKEQQKWLQEHRREAYVAAMSVISKVRLLVAENNANRADAERPLYGGSMPHPNDHPAPQLPRSTNFSELLDLLDQAKASISLLGPQRVSEVLDNQVPIILDDDQAGSLDAERLVFSEMRAALGIKK